MDQKGPSMLEDDYTSEDEEEQAEVHTPGNPYCDDPTCWCHTDVEYHSDVTEFSEEADEEEYQAALDFYGIS